MYSKIKKSSSVLAIVLALAMVLSAFSVLPELKASADAASGDFSQFLTKITLTVAQSGSQPAQNIELTKDTTNAEVAAMNLNIKDGTTVAIHMDFALNNTDPDDPAVGDHVAGKTYTMQLPSVLAMKQSSSGVLSAVQDLGTWAIDTNGLLTVKFSDSADDGLTDRTGGADASSTFSKSKFDNSGSTTIPFTIGTNTVNLPVKVLPTVTPVVPSILKTGKYNSDGTITWKVTVNSGNDGYNNGLTDVIVTDTLGPNQTFNSNPAPTWGGTNILPGTGSGDTPPYYEASGQTITFHLGNMAHDQAPIIQFTTTATNIGDKPVFPATALQYSNTAVLGATEIPSASQPTVTATVGGSDIKWITKSGADTKVNGLTQSIDWTVTVNPGGKGTVPAGAYVTDTLDSNLTIDTTTIKWSSGSSPISSDPADAKGYYEINGQTLTVHFNSDVTAEETVTFKTTVNAAYYNGNNGKFSNQAFLHLNTDSTGSNNVTGVGTGSSVIAKSGTGYDAVNHLATWKITVNSNKVAINNPIVTDTIGNYQKFSSISAKQKSKATGLDEDISLVQKTSAEENPTPIYNTFVVNADKTVTIYLNDFAAGDSPVVLTLVTEVTDKDYYASNDTKTVYNSVDLKSSNNVGGGVSAPQTTPSTVITKAASYDYTSKTITWTVTVNQNQMAMANAEVTDYIPTNLQLVGDVTVNTIPIYGTGTQYYNIDSNNKLTVKLGNISTTQTIVFKTRIPDAYFAANNSGLSFTNTATLTTSDNTVVSNPAKQDVKHSVVEKSGAFDDDNNTIAWTVLINKNQIPTSALLKSGTTSVTLTDQLQDGLELDPSTVKLYPLTVGSTGTLTKGTAITLDPTQNIVYNSQTRLLTFTFPSGTDFSKAYELDFVTDVTKSGNYVNSISLNGAVSDPQNTAGTISVSASQASAWADGKPRGQVIVKKQDKVTGAVLAGTEFGLYVKGTSAAKRVIITDNSGEAVFKNLTQGVEYTIKETKAPTGYQLDSIPWTFTLDATNYNSLPTQTFQDSPIPVNPGGGTPGGNTPSSSETSSVTSSTSSVVSSPSSNPNENIGDDDVGKAGASSKPGSKNPNENIGDDDVGKAGGNPKTGEDRSYLPILLSVMLAAAVLFVLNLAAARRRKNH